MRKKIVIPLVVVSAAAVTGVAFAAIAGFVQVPDAVTGLASGGGSNSCQTTAITFEVPEPTFDTDSNSYIVSTIDYSGISSACTTLTTADLIVTITNGSSTVYATATASNMTLSSGTLTLSQPIEFENAAIADYNFLVRNA